MTNVAGFAIPSTSPVFLAVVGVAWARLHITDSRRDVAVTATFDWSACGPTLPTLAVQQDGSYLGCTGNRLTYGPARRRIGSDNVSSRN